MKTTLGNPGLRITERDDDARTFSFTDGQKSASIRIASLSESGCQVIAPVPPP